MKNVVLGSILVYITILVDAFHKKKCKIHLI